MMEVSSQGQKKGVSGSMAAVDSIKSSSSWGAGAGGGSTSNPPASGKGSHKYPDGGYYEGEFQAGMRHGNGMMIFAGAAAPRPPDP